MFWPYLTMARQMRQTTWTDALIVAIAAGIAVLGLILVLIAVIPGRTKLLAISATDSTTPAGTTRKSVRRSLRASARSVDGISAVEVKVGRRARRAKIDVTTPFRNPGDLRAEVEAAALDRLAQLDLIKIPRITVGIHHREDN